MQIAKHKVVTIDYTLKDEQGTVIDSSEGNDPLAYIHGMGNIIPGLESALEGKSAGDKLNVSVAPEQGYGAKDDALLVEVPRQRFENPDALEVGMQFRTPTDAGNQIVTVVKVEEDQITIDANHPLAGVTLNFDVTIKDVRDATKEELDHGHAHGPGGHDH